ncbi:bifunctional YncE family protein/alkaline phosphatase family protein [Paenibacillus humicola]|uniref:bifunctional YncE family protein/alkaline phosphatase family protein n=1 Tax=Paenibacillus humicola TaxID=3110540 RepID=UPI00237C4292|nr:bifunctional YncE family protein/alkaline phosphatase family protein [Paenibacillus humicola]
MKMKKLGKKKLAALLAAGSVLAGTGSVYAATHGNPFGTSLAGRQQDGSVLTDVNQFVTPAGQQIEFGGNPISVKIRPDGQTAAAIVGRNNYGGKGINIVDMQTGTLKASDISVNLSTMWGLAYSPDGKYLYATGSKSGVGKIVVMTVDDNGIPAVAKTVDLPKASVDSSYAGGNINPQDIVMGPDGKTLLVALNLDNSLGVFDLSTSQLTARIPVGVSPTSVVVSGGKAYVTNVGGRMAQPGDFTVDSSGTPVVATPEGSSATGTVSVVDLATNTVKSTVQVGLQPTRMTVSGHYVLVANTNSDTVSVIDSNTDSVVQTIDIQPYPDAPLGSSPNAVAMIGANRLAVSLGRNNAIAIYQWGANKSNQPSNDQSGQNAQSGQDALSGQDAQSGLNAQNGQDVQSGQNAQSGQQAQNGSDRKNNGKGTGIVDLSAKPVFKGLVPTAWFPVDIAVDASSGKMLVANADGVGSLGPDRTSTIQNITVTGHSSYAQEGSLSLMPFPTDKEIAQGTDEVFQNNNWFDIASRNAQPRNNKKPVPIPERIGEPSTIKHVFYIIKENRTYDQVLGDMGKGNSDPSLVQFGQKVTPNLHKLANTFPLLDNMYTSGIQSASGHQWVMQGTNVDYEDKETDTANIRSYPGGAGDALAYAATGHLWDNALKHNISVVNYGEDTNAFTGPQPFGTWTDWYNDYLILSGQKQGELHVPIGSYQATSDIPSLNPITYKPFPTFDTNIPDQYRYEIFKQQFDQYVKNGDLPQFIPMWVMDDHTSGTDTGSPTPQAQVADNDLAVGKIVDLISHSPYWKDSLILITEDDAQNGLDHVDGHREPAFVVSPWVKRGVVDSHYWTVINMVRTIEQVLGLPPMNQNDAAALPMSELFTDQPDFTPYTFEQNQIPLDTLNGQPAANTAALANTANVTAQAKDLAKQWTEWSNANKQHFTGSRATPDDVNANMLNHVNWYAARGFDTPYPGDDKPLAPAQVEAQPASSLPNPAVN